LYAKTNFLNKALEDGAIPTASNCYAV